MARAMEYGVTSDRRRPTAHSHRAAYRIGQDANVSTTERISVPVLPRLRQLRFAYAELNAPALLELEQRIAAASQGEGVITYAKLTDGVRFRSTTREFYNRAARLYPFKP